ncbi:glycosyltransferase family 2 protein [Pullulanibacillus sp. KACC 23026]|uniref:glycosyltransferase family 2 protein n=1 Tax=Pullulanibacillus sp. KACC 23026 TaxID=3028315 RepID=UPI0023B14004|nr:glycosyltransferase family 2 protein [Pullulanibacillus sp. KACC 23026]WEG13166.1 glycosyltransferase family 2 protein [Pullulanibacillus sp. KACC 23026]
MVKVSVAIPIYNASRHVKVTLDSLVNQTMSYDDFEILCINDCSTDNSEEVIKSFEKQLPNLKLINRTENSGGPMIPRNDAIEAAHGEYILFLDNDDFLGEETLERFYNKAKAYHSDVIYGRYVGVNGRKVPQSMFKKGNLPQADIVKDNLVMGLAPHKMYRLGLLREHGLTFHPKAVVGEDQLFTMQCFIESKVITVLSDYDYYYVVKRGDENLSLKYFPAEQFFFAFYRIMEYINERVQSEERKRELRIAYLNRFFRASRLRKYLLTNSVLNDEQKKLWLAEAQKFIDTHVSDIKDELNPEYHYFIQLVQENDLEKLLFIHRHLENLTANDVSRIENGQLFARFVKNEDKREFDVEVNVTHKNKSKVLLSGLSFGQAFFQLEGFFPQPLLTNYKLSYHLIAVHRETGFECPFPSEPTDREGSFRFTVNYLDLLIKDILIGPWDFFVEAKADSYVSRRRLGSHRSVDIELDPPIEGVELLGKTFTFKPYWTTPRNNLSLDIKKWD